jgi:hypothetical protein
MEADVAVRAGPYDAIDDRVPVIENDFPASQ